MAAERRETGPDPAGAKASRLSRLPGSPSKSEGLPTNEYTWITINCILHRVKWQLRTKRFNMLATLGPDATPSVTAAKGREPRRPRSVAEFRASNKQTALPRKRVRLMNAPPPAATFQFGCGPPVAHARSPPAPAERQLSEAVLELHPSPAPKHALQFLSTVQPASNSQ